MFYIFSLLQMPIVIGKSVNFLLTKFTPKTGQIYPQGVNLPPVKNPCFRAIANGNDFRLSGKTVRNTISLSKTI